MIAQDQSKNFDVAIIGAGITGLGVAFALCNQGLRVAIFDRGKVCQATSNNHLRIIHGGFRYLQSFDLYRMCQSMRDQRRVISNYSDCCAELPCLLPLKPMSLRSKIPLSLASYFYKLLYFILTGKSVSGAKFYKQSEVANIATAMSAGYTQGAFSWTDYLLKDNQLLTNRLVAELKNQGVHFFEYHDLQNGSFVNGQWHLIFNDAKNYAAKIIVNCGGPWVESIASHIGEDLREAELTWLKAFNLEINKRLTESYGIAFHGNQGSMFFATPRGETKSAIGTFYLPASDANTSELSQDELNEAISILNQVLPDLKLKKDQISSIDLGYIPADKNRQALKKELVLERPNSLHVISIKYTTFFSLGEKVAKLINKNICK